MTETVQIDAEYMNRWLGNTKITSLSPKILNDVQTLIEHYRDIIVPGEDLEISFPIEGEVDGPCASVSKGKVYIPFAMLQRGEVDQTIGAMIHELHHIKLTPSEQVLHSYAFTFMLPIMQKIILNGSSIASRLFGDATISYKAVMDSKNNSEEVCFVRGILNDMLLLMNAAEDVRIDENTPPNLKKYIDKSDDKCAPKIVSAFEKGDFDDGTLTSLSYRFLGHHKGMFHCSDIADRFGDKQFIVDSNGHALQAKLFEVFAADIASHIRAKYLRFNPSADAQGDSDFDNYYSQKSGNSDSAARNLEQDVRNDAVMNSSVEEADDRRSATMDVLKAARNTPVTEFKDVTLPDKDMTAAEKLHAEQEEANRGAVMSKQLLSKIQAFRHIQVVTVSETGVDDTPYTFDVVFYDSVQ